MIGQQGIEYFSLTFMTHISREVVTHIAISIACYRIGSPFTIIGSPRVQVLPMPFMRTLARDPYSQGPAWHGTDGDGTSLSKTEPLIYLPRLTMPSARNKGLLLEFSTKREMKFDCRVTPMVI